MCIRDRSNGVKVLEAARTPWNVYSHGNEGRPAMHSDLTHGQTLLRVETHLTALASEPDLFVR
eukprot:4914043-Alexandrium_andersonii.AAC.1